MTRGSILFANCENNNLINIGQHSYYINWDGNLMPMEKDEPPPDLRNFDQPKK
jgi:hypothetical protein